MLGFNNSDVHHLDRLFYTLPAFKADPFRQGITITIAAVNEHNPTAFDRWPMNYVDALHLPEFQVAILVTLFIEELLLQPEGGALRITTFSC